MGQKKSIICQALLTVAKKLQSYSCFCLISVLRVDPVLNAPEWDGAIGGGGGGLLYIACCVN